MDIFCMGCMEKFSDEYQVCPYCGYIVGTKAAEALHIEPGSVLHDRYIVGRVLGFGGFGITYIGWDALLEQKVAIKEYLPSEFSTRMPGVTQVTVFNGDKKEQFRDGMKRFVDEAKRLARFHQCDGIVKVFDSFEDNNTAYIVMEYLQGETLAERLKREGTIPPEQAVEMLIPVIRSLKVVHAEGIIHRDIAPDNIFITLDGQVKLIDFGAARYATTSHSRSLTVIVKPGYSPEEQYRSRGDQGSHTDTYAIGAVLYKMITGVTPPDALERRAFFETKKKDILKPISKYCKSIDSNLETAILNAMNVRIEDRTPDMEQLENELCSEEPVKRREGRIKKIDILKWPLWAKLSVPIAAAAVITLSVLFSMGIIGFDSGLRKSMYIPEGMSRVPSIISEEIKAAEDRLEEASLLYTIVGKEYSSVIPKDLILSQDVSAGTVVLENTNVNVKISGGAEMSTVPSVTGLEQEDAVKQLEEAGFSVSIREEYHNTIAAGAVISQGSSEGGELALGETVEIVISKGRDPDQKQEEKMVKVPEFVGMKYSEALKQAEKLGIILEISQKEYSTQYAKDEVISQSVEKGQEILNSNVIQLVVSLGKEELKVPDVQYMTEEQARKLLGERGLGVKVTYQTSETVAAQVVMSQSPEEGAMAEPGDEVTLVISKGSAPFDLPNVVGKSEDSARTTLIGKGLAVSVSYEYSDEVDSGKVLRQSPGAGSSVYKGSQVKLVVSSGKEIKKVPNVVGQAEGDARSKLEGQGFRVEINDAYSNTVERGKVISQVPGGGSSQEKGATVMLTISAGKEPISVPKLTGSTQSAALETLERLGLKASYSSQYSETVPNGTVISQNPSPGSTRYQGDTITFVVSKGREPITVPSVTRQSESSASNAITSKGLRVSVRREYSSSVASGYVISQSPSGGSIRYRNDTVTIVVSKGKAPNPVTSVGLNKTSARLIAGKTLQLIATVNPSDADNTDVTWKSSNTSIATVSSNGLVTARAQGSTTITATAVDGGKSASCTITVDPVSISRIQVSNPPSKTTYYVGESLNTSGMVLRIEYNDGSSKTVSSGFTCSPTTFSSSGSQQVKVSYQGFNDYFYVTVRKDSISLSRSSGHLDITDSSVRIVDYDSVLYVGDNSNDNGSYPTMQTLTCAPTYKSKSLEFKVYTNSSSSQIEVYSENTSVATCSSSTSGTTTTVTVTAKPDLSANTTHTTRIRIKLNGELQSTYFTISSYRPKSLTLSSSNSSILKVNGDRIYAVDNGTATLTVTTSEGHTDSVQISCRMPSTYRVSASSVGKIMRSGPGTGNSNLGKTIPTNAVVSLLDISYNAGEERIWGKCTYGGVTGWFEMWYPVG